ncbi:hypothetical protein MNB_SM-3-286 [hydrothermal vent metagenome]|uniref:Uncharacterized protein n=1 Tax=hydrothermal vent metagenome TaxID=652676 RepID=A0A1W1BII7_9ZZZZ
MKDTILIRLHAATDIEKKAISDHLKINTTNTIEIAKEYRKAAGHSVANLFRRDKLPYKQILIDVADKLHDSIGWTHFKLEDNHTESDIEKKILEDIKKKADKFKEEWSKLSPKKREQTEKKLRDKLGKEGYNKQAISGSIALLASGGVGVAAATPVALSLFYSGFFASTIASIIGVNISALIAGGAIAGGLIGLPALIAIAGTPAYRKIIPVTIILIQIGQRLEMEKEL